MAKKVIKAQKAVENTVRLVVVGGKTLELKLNNHPTITEILSEAMPKGFIRAQHAVRVGGAEPQGGDEYRPNTGDIITVIPQVAGGSL